MILRLPSFRLACLLFAFLAHAVSAMAAAVAPEIVRDLAFGEGDVRAKAIAAIGGGGDARAQSLLQALLDGDVKTVGEARVLLVKGDEATDLLTGATVKPLPDNLEDIVVNNRLRRELG